MREKRKHNESFLLALHSSTNTLGVAILNSKSPKESIISSTFPIGRYLSNKVVNCIEELFPASSWHQLSRISVAIGPGGFTGTRLTVILARTLAQQLECHLDGISSFALMAPRLAKDLSTRHEPFWITQELPRKGIIAGKYQIINDSKMNSFEEVLELEKPHLLSSECKVIPTVKASENVTLDVVRLLKVSLFAQKTGQKKSWRNVFPIYASSPVK